MTTGAMPNKPDFTPFFGKPVREIKTNPYEACVSFAYRSFFCIVQSIECMPSPFIGIRGKTMLSRKRTTERIRT